MKKLRVFEAFAGIGAQHSALEKANLNYEIVGISEWFINALFAYDAIHNFDVPAPKLPSHKEQIKYLSQFTFSWDSAHPFERLDKLPTSKIEQLYIANKRCKNLGSITEIKGSDMPKCDLLIYSFPCQDLSTGGKTLGMTKGSHTRSSLLWEIQRILQELQARNALPEYLLMENVRAIYANSNKKDLDEWLKFLESLGYKTSPLSSKLKDIEVKECSFLPPLTYWKNGGIELLFKFDSKLTQKRELTAEEIDKKINSEYIENNGLYRYSRKENDNDIVLVTKDELRKLINEQFAVITFYYDAKIKVDSSKVRCVTK